MCAIFGQSRGRTHGNFVVPYRYYSIMTRFWFRGGMCKKYTPYRFQAVAMDTFLTLVCHFSTVLFQVRCPFFNNKAFFPPRPPSTRTFTKFRITCGYKYNLGDSVNDITSISCTANGEWTAFPACKRKYLNVALSYFPDTELLIYSRFTNIRPLI